MLKKSFIAFGIVGTLLFLFVSRNHASNKVLATGSDNIKSLSIDKIKPRLAGPIPLYSSFSENNAGFQMMGYDDIISNSPGLQVGLTTWDLQAMQGMNRQVEWRSNYWVHFAWTKKLDSGLTGYRGTGYQVWDCDEGEFVFTQFVGCDIHPVMPQNRSGFPCLDIDTEGKAIIANHQWQSDQPATTIWYDFNLGGCFFTAYKYRMPDSLMQYGCSQQDIDDDFWFFQKPSMAYQIFEGDTVTHVMAVQYFSSGYELDSYHLHYFRRVGSDTLGIWEYPPMIVDTVSTTSFVVTTSRTSRKAAITWLANPGDYPGDPESVDRFDDDESVLGWSARTNDVYYMTSDNMGVDWTSKVNLTAYDSSQGGWLASCGISAMIDTDDYLHIVWNSREAAPLAGSLGEWTNYFGSRLFHWDEYNSEVRLIKDANWPVTDPYQLCLGGGFDQQWVVQPMISECDGKFYVIFVQFHDIPNGLVNDCAESRYTGGGSPYATANGELYITVSDNKGYNWDIARNVTNTVTPHCYPDESEGTPVCESDLYPSMPKFGMQVTASTDFSGVPIVDPSDGGYTGNYYLDIFYINDKHPGNTISGDSVWTTNLMKWFRVPCIDPVPNPLLVYDIDTIGPGVWTKPGQELDTIIRLENTGNAELVVTLITAIELVGTGWLGVSETGPLFISHLAPNYADLAVFLNESGNVTEAPYVCEGIIEIESNSEGGQTDSIFVNLVIADTLQLPELFDIRTECLRLSLINSGNMGCNGDYIGHGKYNMDFFNDCDTTGNETYDNNVSTIYLYDGSPFVAGINNGDTILNYSMYDENWLSENGLRPIEGGYVDSVSYPDYQYARCNKFFSNDSQIILDCEYFAPSDADTCEFILSRLRVYNNTENEITGLFIGDFFDWDIPSDNGVNNGSGYDSLKNLMYCFGGELNPFATDNDNCILSDNRLSGCAFYGGYKLPYCDSGDSIAIPRAMWTELNADFVYPTGDFVKSQIYQMLEQMEGYYKWEATVPINPDSLYQDLHMVAVFGQLDLGTQDTLVFLKVIASEYDGGIAGLQETIDEAYAWIENRPDLFAWPTHSGELCTCCDIPGDAKDDGNVNILDITYMISYLYKAGPLPPCMNQADVNLSCNVNILDITYLIAFLYKGGPPPTCGCVE